MIRGTRPEDADAIWAVLEPVIRAGETYTLERDLSREDALAYWMNPVQSCFVAEVDGRVLGTYYLRRNQAGGGSHVCNCGYMVSLEARGRGLASAMCKHSQAEALKLGYRAMQFNFVVATNTGAIALWKRLGFDIVGRLPKSFELPSGSIVDALVMYKELLRDGN